MLKRGYFNRLRSCISEALEFGVLTVCLDDIWFIVNNVLTPNHNRRMFEILTNSQQAETTARPTLAERFLTFRHWHRLQLKLGGGK